MIQLVVFFVLYMISHAATLHWNVLFTPLLLVEMMLLSLGCGIALASFTTKYKDLTVLVSFLMQIWMYATPIVYPASEIPESYRKFMMLNPMAPIVETFRCIWFGNGIIPFEYLIISLGTTMLILMIGVVLFQRAQRNFLDTI